MKKTLKSSDYFSIVDWWKKTNQFYTIGFFDAIKGIGKTYSAIQLAKMFWEEYGKSTVWTRRYMTEMEEQINELVQFFPENWYLGKIGKYFCVYDKERSDIPVITFSSISKAQNLKDENCCLWIFDEYNDLFGRTIKNEFKAFTIGYSNLSRTKEHFWVYCFGNYHNANNPYKNRFQTWNWKWDKTFKVLTDGKGIFFKKLDGEDFKKVVEHQKANLLYDYDERLSTMYREGGFTDNFNMIQTEPIHILKTLYKIGIEDEYLYVSKTINNKYYFHINNVLNKKNLPFYSLTLHNGLLTNNFQIEGLDLGDNWQDLILQNRVIFQNFEVRDLIIGYLVLIFPNFELK